MKTVARFVTRLQGKGDGLFIGALMNEGAFKPNTVYEIVDILGVHTIREVGMATGAGNDNCISNSVVHPDVVFHWGTEIGDILESYGRTVFLTIDEWKQYLALDREQMSKED